MLSATLFKSVAAALSILPSTLALTLPRGTSTTCCTPKAFTSADHDRTVANWLNFWAGDTASAYSIAVPHFTLYQDRFPSRNGSTPFPVHNTTDLIAFNQFSRAGWETYNFVDTFHFGSENMVTLRWSLNATARGAPYTNLAPGTFATYNGTDVFRLDVCTGLIETVYSAQDLITLFHEIKVPIGVNGTV